MNVSIVAGSSVIGSNVFNFTVQWKQVIVVTYLTICVL